MNNEVGEEPSKTGKGAALAKGQGQVFIHRKECLLWSGCLSLKEQQRHSSRRSIQLLKSEFQHVTWGLQSLAFSAL